MLVALLLTRMSTGPNCFSVSRARFSRSAARPTWHSIGTVLPGREENSFAGSWSFSLFRLAITTLAPAWASRLAIAFPIPRPPPVTMAVFPLTLGVIPSTSALADYGDLPQLLELPPRDVGPGTRAVDF